MPEWKYSVKDIDIDRTVKSSSREISVSPKASVEICKTIKGMKLSQAKSLLEDVIKKKRSIPYKTYSKKVPHRRHQEKWHAGRYPVKAARIILRLLEELESNAEYKGFNIENLQLIHAITHRGRKVKKAIPRAHGRASPDYDTLIHIELIGYEAF